MSHNIDKELRTSPDLEPRLARKIRCLTALTGREMGQLLVLD